MHSCLYQVETERILDYLFPPLEEFTVQPLVYYDYNAVKFKLVILYGKIGSGKTELVRSLAEQAVKRYGADKVAASYTNADLETLLEQGLKDKLVNILFCDDLTHSKIKEQTLNEFFRVRHKLKEYYGRRHGYILGVLALHRFFNIPVSLRAEMDCLICRNTSLNPYDSAFLKRMLGFHLYQALEEIERRRESDREFYQYSAFVSKDLRGLLRLPLAEIDYLEELRSQWRPTQRVKRSWLSRFY